MNKLIENIGNHLDNVLKIDECRYGQMPADINNVVLLNFKSGVKPTYVFDRDNSLRRRPFLQVIVRNEDYFEGLKRVNDVFKELERLHGVHGILSITSTSDILEYGRDSKNNYSFLTNFILDVEEE